MQKYNFFRPLMIILVAFLVNNLVRLIGNGFGIEPETTEMLAVGAMVIAALFTYTRMNRNRRPKK